MSEIRLETQALSRHFGALVAVQEIDFKLAAGARHALIGPNGAGKTTFINLLTGVLSPTHGRVLLPGRDITAKAQAERVKLGIARTFQINRLFRGLSVLENVCMAVAERVGAAGSMFYPAGRRTDVIDESMQLLQTLKLADAARHRVSELPYGRQRLVELAIAIGLKPEVLLLDEPAAGVPSAESHIILDAIERLPEHIAVLIIEHDMDVVFRFAKRVTVMVSGALFAEGTPREIEANPQVREVYLGQAGQRTGHRTAMASALQLRGVSAGYGETVVIEDIDLTLAPRRVHQRDRPQRRRQDHAARRPSWATPRCTPARSCSTAASSTACRAFAARSPASASCRRSARFFPRCRCARTSTSPRGRGTGRMRASSNCFRGSRSGSTTWAISSPAASSRCCRSRARCSPIPPILLMDEPTEGLAPVLVEALTAVLAQAARRQARCRSCWSNRTAAWRSTFSPRTVILDKGRIVYDGAVRAAARRSGPAGEAHRDRGVMSILPAFAGQEEVTRAPCAAGR